MLLYQVCSVRMLCQKDTNQHWTDNTLFTIYISESIDRLPNAKSYHFTEYPYLWCAKRCMLSAKLRSVFPYLRLEKQSNVMPILIFSRISFAHSPSIYLFHLFLYAYLRSHSQLSSFIKIFFVSLLLYLKILQNKSSL